jgi:hypothetical protein
MGSLHVTKVRQGMPGEKTSKEGVPVTLDFRTWEFVESAIGRAWSAGLLEVDGKCSIAMRDKGREVAALYWRHFGNHAPQDTLAQFLPSGGGKERDLEAALNMSLDRINAMGRDVRSAFDKLTINEGPTGFDSGPVWLDRLVLAKRKGEAPPPHDRRLLDVALLALSAIA